jgi:ubiquitin C-terminal hydrolase
LKRFDFDFNTMARNKINDFFEFPHELNLFPWSLQHLNPDSGLTYPKSYYTYRLVGVLVHSGIADAGHYYSFINERGTEKWYCFDDRRVYEFDVRHGNDEWFGGLRTSAFSRVAGATTFEKSNSAYLLFYERVEDFSQADTATDEAS